MDIQQNIKLRKMKGLIDYFIVSQYQIEEEILADANANNIHYENKCKGEITDNTLEEMIKEIFEVDI